MSDKLARILETVKQAVRQAYGEHAEVWLYGSHARGEANADSDIDLLVVVDDTLEPISVRHALSELLFQILLTEQELVSVCVMRHSDYYLRQTPFLQAVKREAVLV